MKTYKIIRVLECIKEYCKEKSRCEECPFYDSSNYECYLLKEGMIYPAEWEVGIIKGKLMDIERIG